MFNPSPLIPLPGREGKDYSPSPLWEKGLGDEGDWVERLHISRIQPMSIERVESEVLVQALLRKLM